MGLNKYVKATPSQVATMMIIGIGLALTALTFQVGIRMPWLVFLAFIFGSGAAGYYLFVVGVKFYSFLVVTENYRTTTFHPRVKVVWDEGWKTHLGLVFAGGYNSPGKLLSWPDIEKPGGIAKSGKVAELFVTADPFMIESVANTRFLVIRGKSRECNHWETAAFFKRPSIQAAIGDEVDGIKRLYWVMSSTSLHPDDVSPESLASVMRGPSDLDDLASLFQRWQAEYRMTNEQEEERVMRGLHNIEKSRSGRSKAPAQVTVHEGKEESTDE